MIYQHRVWVYGDHVNTDMIFPGKYTYTLRTEDEIASHALEDLDPHFAETVQAGDMIIAGKNWGCGSSREQAVTCLKYQGIQTIIARSFSGLYFRNCIHHGIRPIICDLQDHVKTGDKIQIDEEKRLIQTATVEFLYEGLSASVEAILAAGGLVPMLQSKYRSGE
ncbi:3-isopropylmalate dehydratase small subunit [Anaerolineales bacterium]